MNSLTVSNDICLEEKGSNIPNKLDSMTFVLFGSTGDLAKRKIFPALYNLFLDGKLPASFSVIGLGRRSWSNHTFQSHIEDSLKLFSRRLERNHATMEKFLSLFHYTALDVTNEKSYEELLDMIEQGEKELNIPENRLFYLSVSPEYIDVITSNINKSGLGSTKGWKRLIIEKPFGHDLLSAQQLNHKLMTVFEENEIYRIDHYLGKPMVQNLEAITFANPILQVLWSNNYISNIQITASEEVGVEERASYYDQAGAIRDMFQNHMLQLLMMTAMHIPTPSNAKQVREEKIKIMEHLRPLQKETIDLHIVRGQYDSGEIRGKSVVGYKEEPGINPCSLNDTFVAARLWIDHYLWRGVPFYIRTGKRMKKKSTRIVIEFKNTLKKLDNIEDNEVNPNLLIIEIGPNEGISLQLNSKNPLNHNKIEPISIKFSSSQEKVPEAYELLLFDVLKGDPTFFASWKEVELSWDWIQPILEAFKDNNFPLHSYSSGSMGPDASDQLLKNDGFKWW
jgi:glucose-6-phosphate 1-dehydrogenase